MQRTQHKFRMSSIFLASPVLDLELLALRKILRKQLCLHCVHKGVNRALSNVILDVFLPLLDILVEYLTK